jgi:hypothetical protein
MENKPLVDMSPDATQERKVKITKLQELAEKVWDEMCNEGDINEKEYWIKGFIVGNNIGKD